MKRQRSRQKKSTTNQEMVQVNVLIGKIKGEKIKKGIIKTGTWNVRTLLEAGNMQELSNELERCKS